MKAREPRRSVTIPARMRSDAGWSDVTIRNATARGLGLHSAAAPKRGDYIEVCRHHHKMVARVIWSDGQSFGVQLSDPIVVDDLVSSRAPDRKAGERRLRPRQGDQLRAKPPQLSAADAAHKSRQTARLMHFAAITAIACIGAGSAAMMVHSVLSDAAGTVSEALANSRIKPPSR